MDAPVDEWLAIASSALGLIKAPLTHDVVLASRAITLPHRDPADRLIAATARYYELRLVTADGRVLRGAGFSAMAVDGRIDPAVASEPFRRLVLDPRGDPRPGLALLIPKTRVPRLVSRSSKSLPSVEK